MQFHPDQQLPLAMSLADDMTLDNFVVNAQNEELMFVLRQLLQDDINQSVFVWGNGGVGKSHLLQAMCAEAVHVEKTAVYIDLKADYVQPEMLEGLEYLNLICIDHIEVIAGDSDWEQALFHCYNRIKDADNKLIMAANQAPSGLSIQLPDLHSRLNWAVVYRVFELDDQEKKAWMVAWCKDKGMPLSLESASYLITRLGRNMHEIIDIMHKVERETLIKKRKVTIPFLKQLLDAM